MRLNASSVGGRPLPGYVNAVRVDAFASRLRDQVDLDVLSAELVGVVSDTVHPAHAGLWLREGRR